MKLAYTPALRQASPMRFAGTLIMKTSTLENNPKAQSVRDALEQWGFPFQDADRRFVAVTHDSMDDTLALARQAAAAGVKISWTHSKLLSGEVRTLLDMLSQAEFLANQVESLTAEATTNRSARNVARNLQDALVYNWDSHKMTIQDLVGRLKKAEGKDQK